MRKITCITIICINMVLLSSCHIYRNYQRPDNLPTDSLFRDADNQPVTDSLSLGDLPWQEIFQDTLLQQYIRYGLEHNTDMQTALLRIDQAKAQLTAAKLSFLPSLTLSPQGTLTSTAGSKTVKTYELPVQASWEIDLFGNLRNAKKGTQATLLQQQTYQQAVRSELIAGIANTYYSLLMLDEQVAISQSTLEVWKEQVRTMEARMKVGEETENAVTQARASLYELEATHNDLLRQQRETENSLCTLLGMTSRSLERGTLDKQIFPETLPTGIPVRLLSRRPDIVQAEMTLANAYYTTNQARSAFYPNLNLSGSAGWTNALGQAVTNPGDWILSAVASLTQPLFNRGKLISNLRVSKDEEQIALLNYRQALLDAGINWYEAKNTMEFYLLEGRAVEILITSLTGKGNRIARIVPEELQEGIIRLRISVEMRDDTHLKVELEDLGFGTFRAATHHIWKEEIEL